MATAGESSQMHDITKCSICLETFKEPKVLPCIHTFCLECLQALCKDLSPGHELACPLCRNVFTVPLGGVQNVPSNFFMNQLLEVNEASIAEMKCDLKKAATCELCSDSGVEVTASAFCVECDQCFCDGCSKTHKKIKGTRSHQVVAIEDIASLEDRKKMSVTYCQQHPDKQIELYCYDCKTITCVTCYVENHNKHECADIKKSAEKFNEQLKEDISKVSTCVVRSWSKVEEMEANVKRFVEKVEATEAEISKLLEELNSFKIEGRKKLECKKDEFEHQIVIMESFIRYCQEMKNKGTACDISRAANDLHTRAEELVMTETQKNSLKLCEVDINFRSKFAEKASENNFIGGLFLDGMQEPIQRYPDVEAVVYSPPSPQPQLIEEPAQFIVWDSRALLEKPKLLHVMPGNGSISGITVLGKQLFVIRGKTYRGVDVYDSTTFAFQGFLQIPESETLDSIVASDGFLFISYSKGKQLLRYNCDKRTYDYVQLNGVCRSLSKTKNGKLLVNLEKKEFNSFEQVVSCYEIGRMEALGSFITVAKLDSRIIPLHCIEVGDSYYLVVGSNVNQNGVYIVDTIRRITNSYCNQLLTPSHVAMDKQGFVLITNSYDNTVSLLSPELSRLGNIEIPGHKLNDPRVLYLDEVNHRLYVGESPSGRLFVLEAGV